jgi:hypothetical protein
LSALKGEGRAGAVAQQPFQSGPVVAGDAHASVEREAAVVPGEHVAGVIGIEQPVAGDPAQHPAAHLRFDRGHRFWRQCQGLSELDPAGFERLEHPVEDAAVTNPPGADLGARQGARSAKTRMVFVIVQVAIERGTEAVDEAHCPEAGPCRGPGRASAQMGLDHPQEDVQHGRDRLWLTFQVPAQPLGYRQHPLAHRQGREDPIDQVGGGLGHAPSVARGADAAPLAGEGHQEIVSARGAAGPSEAVGQDAAFQVTPKLPFHVDGHPLAVPIVFPGQREVGLQVLLHDPVQARSLGMAATVRGRSASRSLGDHVHVGIRLESGAILYLCTA